MPKSRSSSGRLPVRPVKGFYTEHLDEPIAFMPVEDKMQQQTLPGIPVVYEFTYMPAKYYPEVQAASSVFPATSVEQAEQHCAFLIECRLRQVIPGEGTCKMRPLKLIEKHTGRVVKDFAADHVTGFNMICQRCQSTMTAGPTGWTCPHCHGTT